LKWFTSCILLFLFVLVGCSNETETVKQEDWKVSPTLTREIVVTDKGDKGEFVFSIENNGKLGVQQPDPDNSFIVGKPNKYFWMFWGDKETLTKPIMIVGISKKSGESLNVFEIPQGQSSLAPLYGADHTMPSSIKLPETGLWRLEVHFGEELEASLLT